MARSRPLVYFFRVQILLALLFSTLPLKVRADHLDREWRGGRPGGHAPIGVMADHTHNEGELMLSYRYMVMDMDGNRTGSNRVSTAEVLQDFMVSPVKMEMQMHMLGAMYAPSDFFTAMIMLPFIDLSMDHLTRMGGRFTTSASGVGDIVATGLWKVFDEQMQRIHINTGVSLPSGDIDQKDTTPAGPNSPLPYPMQLGSGTVDLKPGVTYLGHHEDWGWGAQTTGTIRLGENNRDYTLGNRWEATAWGSYDWATWLGNSVRLAYSNLGNIDGADDRLNPMAIPTARADLRGGQRLDLGLGMNFYAPADTKLAGFRVAFEVLVPLYQDLDGPQLETDVQFISGLQYSF